MKSWLCLLAAGAVCAFEPAQYAGLIATRRFGGESLQPRPAEVDYDFPLSPFKPIENDVSARGVDTGKAFVKIDTKKVDTKKVATQKVATQKVATKKVATKKVGRHAASSESSDEPQKPAAFVAKARHAASSEGSQERHKPAALVSKKTLVQKVQKQDPVITDASEVKDRKYDDVPDHLNTRCDKDVNGGLTPGIVSTADPNEQIVTDTIEACQAKCNEIQACQYITYFTGDKFKGRCIMTNWCNEYPRAVNPEQGYATKVMKKACVCIHRYPDVPCQCQKPHMTIDFPGQNAGLDAVYDPMNPSANNNVNAV